MEYSFSSWIEDTFVLEFSDDEYDRMGQTENFINKEQIRRDSKRRYSVEVMHDHAKVQLENYCDFKDPNLNATQKSKYSALPQHSPEKSQTTITAMENDEMVNVSKLIYQLLNAKVVIEKMCESSEKDLTSETKCVLLKGSQLKDSIQRYCPKCKTLKADKHGVKLIKFCLKCETTLKYVCSKCNIKQYSHYESLRMHWNNCRQTANTCKNLRPSYHKDSIQRYCPKCETLKADKHQITVRKSCPKCDTTLKFMCSKCSKQYLSYYNLIMHWNKCKDTADTCKKLNPNDFLVQKTKIDYSRGIIRYCSRCNKIEENCSKWKEEVCRNCNHYLLYQCNKCKAQFNKLQKLTYHMQSKCYSSQYKCNQCDFRNPLWESMRRHVENVHFNTKINCPRCDIVMKNKNSLQNHLKTCGEASSLRCDYCPFKTKYKRSIRDHMKSTHGE